MLKFLADEDVPRTFSSQLRLHLLGVIVVCQAVPIGPALRQLIRYATERTMEIDGQVVFISAPRRILL